MRISDWSSDVCSSDLSESEDHLRSPDQERTQRNDHRKRCHDGPRERFIDRKIENWNDLHLPVFSQIFSNSIINDNGIVKRIANDGQYRSHDVEIEFKLCQREKSEGQRHVMDKGEQGTDTELPFKPEPDIDRNGDHREQHCIADRSEQFTGHFPGHGIHATETRARIASPHTLLHSTSTPVQRSTEQS